MAGYKIDRQLADFGEHVRGWRMVLGLTAQQVSERAGITRDTLRKIEAVGRPHHPRAELRDRVLAQGLVPIASFARAGPVGPGGEVGGDTAHDELRRGGREPRVAPPAEPALDVGIVPLPRDAVVARGPAGAWRRA